MISRRFLSFLVLLPGLFALWPSEQPRQLCCIEPSTTGPLRSYQSLVPQIGFRWRVWMR